jgi:hypothetical protein
MPSAAWLACAPSSTVAGGFQNAAGRLAGGRPDC